MLKYSIYAMKIDKIKQLFLKEEKAGEQKVNIIRLIAIIVFFANELFNYYITGVAQSKLHFSALWVMAFWEIFAASAWFWINQSGK